MRAVRLVPALAALLAAGCADDQGTLTTEQPDAGRDVPMVAVDRPPPDPSPLLLAVQPEHGSFLGGTAVTLRGSNFTEGAVVRFGGNLVQPRDTALVDRNRLTVRTPAGRPGPVDVTVEVNGRTATLPNGYRYDAVYVDPALGPTTGNARVSLHGMGTHFADGMRVTFDGLPCTEVTVTSDVLASCLTPAHPDGRVDVAVDNGAEQIALSEAYLYADSADTVGGGLSGGPLAGSLTVTVLDAMTAAPIPSAFVFLNDAPAAVPPSAGQTSERGQVTLSPMGLAAPVTVTASERCHTTVTVQSFDARSATIYLQPVMLPGCGMGSGMGTPPRPVYAANISGELVWAGSNEFAPNAWSNIPMPREGFRRVAYVWASRPDIFTADPTGAALTQQRGVVVEVVRDGYGGRGYPFSIAARPAALAVYALAGIENVVPAGSTTPVRFTPWVMGVARSVLGSPRAEIENVVIDMNIPLDHETPLTVAPVEDDSLDAPDTFTASAFIDLGGEGVIPLPHATVTGFGSGDFRLSGLPAFNRNLADARLTVHARVTAGPVTGPTAFQDAPAPLTGLVISGLTSPDEAVPVRGWLGIPQMTSPAAGGRLPDDRRVTYEVRGPAPDLFLFTMQWASGSWQHFSPSTAREVRYPDLSSLMGLSDLPSGAAMTLSLVGLQIRGFEFNRFTYASIAPGYWTAYAGRGSYLLR